MFFDIWSNSQRWKRLFFQPIQCWKYDLAMHWEPIKCNIRRAPSKWWVCTLLVWLLWCIIFWVICGLNKNVFIIIVIVYIFSTCKLLLWRQRVHLGQSIFFSLLLPVEHIINNHHVNLNIDYFCHYWVINLDCSLQQNTFQYQIPCAVSDHWNCRSLLF